MPDRSTPESSGGRPRLLAPGREQHVERTGTAVPLCRGGESSHVLGAGWSGERFDDELPKHRLAPIRVQAAAVDDEQATDPASGRGWNLALEYELGGVSPFAVKVDGLLMRRETAAQVSYDGVLRAWGAAAHRVGVAIHGKRPRTGRGSRPRRTTLKPGLRRPFATATTERLDAFHGASEELVLVGIAPVAAHR